MKNFDFKIFRNNLKEKILNSPEEERRNILKKAKQTEEYKEAEKQFLNELPIQRFEKRIKEVILKNDSCIIVGATGSGKTTEIPGYLLDVLQGKVLVTQPRPLAASSICKYVAAKRNALVGQEIGYQIRFDNHTTEGTRLNFITDGIFLRIVQSNPLLEGYSAVMIDEAHERSQNIDFSLGLLKEVQAKRKEKGLLSLKIIVSSATIEKDKFSQYFNSPSLEIPGRLYPVQISYEQINPELKEIPFLAAKQVQNILEKNSQGDILIFMPGEQEISETIKEINNQIVNKENIEILPLYGQMDPESQNRIFLKNGKRKIIVSTNIAETSLTIPGIVYVIDSCLIKQMQYYPDKGIQSLEVIPHSQSGLTQRAGRAGRIQPGFCHRLCSEKNFNNLVKFSTPEIIRSNLANVVLAMKNLKISPENFDFIDKPESKNIQEAMATLTAIGALDQDGNITKEGKIMNELPLEPHLGRILVESEKYNNTDTMVTIASFLSGKNVFVRPKEKASQADEKHKQFKNSSSDFLTFLNIWKAYEKNNYNYKWASDNFLNPRVLNEIKEIRFQLLRILRNHNIRAEKNEDPDSIGLCITAGLLDKLYFNSGSNMYTKKQDDFGSSAIYIHPSSALFLECPPIFVCSTILKTSKPFALNCQPVKKEWLFPLAPELFDLESYPEYDSGKDEIIMHNVYSLSKGRVRERVSTTTEAKESEKTSKVYFEGDYDFIKNYIPESNKIVFDNFSKLYTKDKQKQGYKSWTRDPNEYYIFLLDKIYSRKEFLQSLEDGKFNLEVKLEDLISIDDQQRINKENPDDIIINNTTYQIKYSLNCFHEYGRSIEITMKPEDFVLLQSWPQLPSQEPLNIAIEHTNSIYQSSGADLESLKNNILKDIQKSQFYQAKENGLIKEKFIPDFSLDKDIQYYLDSPIEYGLNPIDKKPFLAYSGLGINTISWSGEKKLSIDADIDDYDDIDIKIYSRYFIDPEEAQKNTEHTIKILKEKNKQGIVEQNIPQITEEIEKIKEELKEVENKWMSDYKGPLQNLTVTHIYDLQDLIDRCERAKERKRWLEFQTTFDQLKELLQQYEKVSHNMEMISQAVSEYYTNCPVCNHRTGSLFECSEKHPAEKFRNNEKEFLLTGIVNERDEIVAGAVAIRNEGSSYSSYRVEILAKTDTGYNRLNYLDENVWDGKTPFETLHLKDFNNINNIKTIHDQHQQEMIRYYNDHPLEYDKDVEKLERAIIESKQHHKGKFKKGINPINGEESWYTEINNTRFFLDLVTSSLIPSSENLEYFFYTKKYSGGSDCRAYLIEPLPEYKPNNNEPELIDDSSKESVADLVEQWKQKNKKLS